MRGQCLTSASSATVACLEFLLNLKSRIWATRGKLEYWTSEGMTLRYLLFLIVGGGLLPAVLALANADDLKPYPSAQAGQERMVIHLPALSDEAAHKVEILVGQQRKVDCNRHAFEGTLTEEVVSGWGYPYYELRAVGPLISTLMGCPPNEQPRDTFVLVHGDGFLQRYNSRLPVVVYVPTGFEVRYRIWEAGPEIGQAQAE